MKRKGKMSRVSLKKQKPGPDQDQTEHCSSDQPGEASQETPGPNVSPAVSKREEGDIDSESDSGEEDSEPEGNGTELFPPSITYCTPKGPVDIKYCGLKNQGATCYLNSVLQVLFMTKDFREAVKSDSANSDKKCTDQLKRLFKNLETSTVPATTAEITHTLGIRVCEQCDAAEYFEKILNDTSPNASQIFRGELTHKNTCKECKTDRNTIELFWSLPLRLEPNNKDYNVVEGIKDFFKELYTDGENQLYCYTCDAKTDATIKLEMTHHPDVLTLLLKRFKFDYLDYVKIKRVVTIPDMLQIPENQTYELYAIVEHFGELRYGHYTVTIKSQDDNRWYNFNDSSVTRSETSPKHTSSSAYLLFYRTKKMQDTQDTGRLSTVGSPTSEQQGTETRKRDNEEEDKSDNHPCKQEIDKDKDNVQKIRKVLSVMVWYILPSAFCFAFLWFCYDRFFSCIP